MHDVAEYEKHPLISAAVTLLTFTTVLAACVGSSTSSDPQRGTDTLLARVEKRLVQPAELITSPISGRVDDDVRLEVGDSGDFGVWRGTERIAGGPGIYYDVTTNESGSVAWASQGPDRSTTIVLDSEPVSATDAVLRRTPVLTDQALFWLELPNAGSSGSVMRFDLLTRTRTSLSLSFLPTQLVETEVGVAAAGFDPSQDLYVVVEFDSTLGTAQHFESPNSLVLGSGSDHVTIYEIESSGAAGAEFFAYASLYGDQFGEPYSYGTNDYGRITWNQSRRLLAMVELYELNGDQRLAAYVEQTVRNLLARGLGPAGFSTTKYSTDLTSRLDLQVSYALPIYSMLRAGAMISPETRADVIAFAESEFERYEATWKAPHYSFPSCIAYDFDGLPLPWNMQSAVGLMLVELFRWTGDSIYGARLTAMYDAFADDLRPGPNGLELWHYWPSVLYDGWEAETFETCNAEPWEPESDPLFTDNSHGALDMEFVERAAVVLERDPVIDLVPLAESVLIAPNSYSRFLGGDVEYQAANYRFLPAFVVGPRVAALFDRLVAVPVLDFDGQTPFQGHAKAARLLADTPGMVRLSVLELREGASTEVGTLELIEEQGVCNVASTDDRLMAAARALGEQGCSPFLEAAAAGVRDR